MRRKIIIGLAAAAAMAFTVVGISGAAVTYDADTGVGFVGKGDVQNAFGWNNKALQDNYGELEFGIGSEVSQTWTCQHPTNESNSKEEELTTTVDGTFSSVARERNQITGFNLTGYDGNVKIKVKGPELNTCNGNFILTEEAGDPVEVGAGVYVSHPDFNDGDPIGL